MRVVAFASELRRLSDLNASTYLLPATFQAVFEPSSNLTPQSDLTPHAPLSISPFNAVAEPPYAFLRFAARASITERSTIALA
jgi:hypothetical protein